MRVIAGHLGGRNFASPGTRRTHPMSDKAKGALFNTLGDITGMSLLDAYAGSGALAIEAVSRGAASVLAIDVDTDAIKTIAANVEVLALQDQIEVLRKNISGWSRNHQQRVFDIVLADPPYTDIRPDVIERLAVHVKPGGILVLSWPGREAVRPLKTLDIVSHKSHGDIQLVFYQRPN